MMSFTQLLCFGLLVLKTEGFINLANSTAYKGTPSQSSTYDDQPWTADKAVDGRLEVNRDESTCSFTKDGKSRNAWWKLPLKIPSNVAYLEIQFRNGTVPRQAGFSVYVFNDTSYIPPSTDGLAFSHNPATCPNQMVNVTINRVTKGIALYNSKTFPPQTSCADYNNGHATIEICEVRVMGCQARHYGPNCDFCDEKCLDKQCDVYDGSCIYGCTNSSMKPPHCNIPDCLDGYFGIPCRKCGKCLNQAPCNKSTGECQRCRQHWKSPHCSVCEGGFYGLNCSESCGHCRTGKFCNNITGVCPNGCQNHWNGSKCDVCKEGFYGPNCSKACGHCKTGSFCTNRTGECTNGCQDHWSGSKCNVCKDGFYDSNCSEACGHCKTGMVCNKTTGECPGECEGHWSTPKCDVCKGGFYGLNCSKPCGHCKTGTFCNKMTGGCQNGCEDHWSGQKCDVCEGGFYSQNCSKACGHCKTGTYCNSITGVCQGGCQDHWGEYKCNVCKAGFYDSNCSKTCGHCTTGTFCNNMTGACPEGCEDHWNGSRCDVCKDGFHGLDCSESCGHCETGTFCDKSTGVCQNGCKDHWNGTKCDVCADGFYGGDCDNACGHCKTIQPVCEKTEGNCSAGCQQGWQEPNCDVPSLKVSTADSQKAIIGGTVSTAAVLLILGAVLIIILRRRMSKSDSASERSDVQNFTFRKGLNKSRANQYANISGTHQNTTETKSDASCNVPEIKETEDGGYYNTVQINTDIRIEDLQDVILRKSVGENNTFLHEYKKFPPGDVNICQTAKKTENVVKNRFKTTFPYEHSRVVLKEKWSDSENDYINANFIKDCNGEKIYIAAQGPKNNTLTDFWRMIWQESIETIVMLTNLIENGKNKCTQYWPEKGKVMEVGPCKVTLVKETAYSFHMVRILSVQRKNSPNKRRISQFHYIAWPDHGTPEELGLAQFHSVVTRACSPGTPCLVHCSAGVGRTGTYIALDSLLKHEKETERINVFEFVKKMREDRMTMVQTPEQYVFLHKALLCGFQDKNTLVPESDFLAKTTKLLNDTSPLNQRHLYEEFKFLSELKPVHEKNEEAENAENREKNVTMDILPVSKYQPFLTTFVKGRNDYINAVRVPSFTNSTGFIMTQMPLSGTEVDLWRLCMDHDAEAMVILNDNSEDIAWLPRRGLSQSCPPFILRTGDTGSDMNGVSQDSLTISCNEQKRTIDVFQMPSGNDNSMLKGTDLLLEKGKESNFTTIVISRNGAGATGIFCVLHNALQQLRMDGEVDIFTAVRQIQTRRPEVITDLEAYRRCYHLLSLFLSEDGIYANM